MHERKTLGILLFNEVEVLDFCGPFEVFSVTRLDQSKRREEPSPFEVVTVAQNPGAIIATGGLSVNPSHTFATCPQLDILCVPGGWGTRREFNNPAMIEWIRERSREAELTVSVCTGALLLGKAGLLEGRRATTHHGAFQWMRDALPNVTVVEEERVVDEGGIITSGGISAGIDMALAVVERYFGPEIAAATVVHMEYRWK